MAEKNASEVPRLRRLILSGFLCLLFNGLNYAKADYEIGVGIADVTGPIAEINFVSTTIDIYDCLIGYLTC